MHHPGPPRFTSVGERVELAPRAPDPNGRYEWDLVESPRGSEVSLDDAPVVHLAPDVPGTYVAELDAPDGTHRLTIRAFPDERRSVRFSAPVSEFPEGTECVSVTGAFNDHLIGRDRPEIEEGEYVLETRLPPGEYTYGFAPDDDLSRQVRGTTTVPGPGPPRLTLDARVEDEGVAVVADAAGPPSSGTEVGVEFYGDDRDPLPEEEIEVDGHVARIPREAIDGRARIHAVPVADRYGVADCVDVRGEGDSITVERPNSVPEWLSEAVIYELFVRSFAGERQETTFSEVERRLPYLEWLGVDCLWLTPVLAGPTRHGYHITDLFATAADLGSRAEFESLVDAAHGRGIRVVFDLVINHTSRDHPFYQLSAAGHPRYRDWYVWEGGEAERYFDWESIPNLNFDSLSVREHLLRAIDEWAPLVDGFRCDVAWGVPHGFWKEVRERVRERDPEFLLLDETIPNDPSYAENEFDLHYDTDLYYALCDVGRQYAPATAILDAVERRRETGFPEHATFMTYVENHDETRYREACGREAFEAAVAATFALPGVPMVYYGGERGVPEKRGPMRWDGDDAICDLHRRLIDLRSREPVLREGSVERIAFETDSAEVVAFAREGERSVVVALNFGHEEAVIAVDPSVEPRSLLDGATVGEREDGRTRLSVGSVVVCPTGESRRDK